jgi:hypothetical protein
MLASSPAPGAPAPGLGGRTSVPRGRRVTRSHVGRGRRPVLGRWWRTPLGAGGGV